MKDEVGTGSQGTSSDDFRRRYQHLAAVEGRDGNEVSHTYRYRDDGEEVEDGSYAAG